MGFGLFPIHEMENHKDMFETTNQITIIFPLWLVYTLLTTINITVFQTTNHQPPTSIVCGKQPQFLDHFWNGTTMGFPHLFVCLSQGSGTINSSHVKSHHP